MDKILVELSNIGIVPVIKIDDVEKAVPLARALVAGGIPCAEVTFRTAEGEEAIRRICEAVPDMIVGAGTILSVEQLDRAVAAGASFIVSPGFNPEVVGACCERNIPVVPGCATPSDMERALSFGLKAVKFFPAEQAGGLPYIKAVSAPYSSLMFMPTGGIGAHNLNEYLAFDKIIACGGSWMVKPELIAAGDFDAITALCREAVEKMLDFEVVHVGINCENAKEAEMAADRFEFMFGFKVKEGNASYFAGMGVELHKFHNAGKHGHIAIGVNNAARARAFLERKGFRFREDTANVKKNRLKSIYLEDEVAGFALHLLEK